MRLPSLLRGLFGRPSTIRRRPAYRLAVEPLEDRSLLSLAFGTAFSLEGSAAVEAGKAIAVDGDGNRYVQGFFLGTIDADPGPGTHLLTSVGDTDLFVAKYTPSGGLVWAARMGGPEADQYSGGGDLTVDGSGNVFVTGSLRGTAGFGPFTLTSQGPNDIFVAKLDAATGTFQWVTQMGDTQVGTEDGFSIAADGLGNVYTTGSIAPTESIFVAKHDTNGNLLWLRKIMGQVGAGGVGGAYDLALDGSGNAYVTGKFIGAVDFNPGSGTFTLSSTKVRGLADNWDAFALSLDSGGNFRWAFKVTGEKNDEGKAIAVDGSGNIYLAGDFASTANDFDPGKSTARLTNAGGYRDVFVAKYSSSRSLIWARSMGGPGEDMCDAIAVDGSGQVYTTGHFSGTADFNPGSGTNSLTSAGIADIFVSQLSSAGNYVWAGQMGGTSGESAKDLTLDGAGNVYLTGSFKGQADFDPGAGEYILTSTLDSNGNPTVDVFVSKLVPLDALQAADGTAPHAAGRASLSALQITPLLTEALARWRAAGVDTSAFANIDIRIADLGGTTLGFASGNTIWLDDNAAGWGWFVDATPWDDSEFTTPGNQGEQHRMDLLTVLEHELGHLLGFDHQETGVMEDTLATGTRKTPTGQWAVQDTALLDLVFAGEQNPLRRKLF